MENESAMAVHETIPEDPGQLHGVPGSPEQTVCWVIAWREYLVLAEPVGQRAPETTNSVEVAMKFPTWKAARAGAVGLWNVEVFDDPRVFVISVAQLAALRDWRSRHGDHWRMWLKKRWDRGDCEPDLRQLRNMFGPGWLYKQRLVR